MAGEPEPAVVPARELRCPNCGAPWTLRGFNTTRTLGCEHCGSVIDTSGEHWQLVEKVEGAYNARPRFALGTRGELMGVKWEVIGWCSRYVRAYGQKFTWEEHLLYNPYEGFRYLVYQDGHFVFVTPLPGVATSRPMAAAYEDKTYKHFSTGKAIVEEVLGEFPWEVRRGDTAKTDDYVAPPLILSKEETAEEVTWSRGEYVEPDVVLKAFGKPARAVSQRKGVHACQPNPHRPMIDWMLKATGAALVLWALVSFIYMASNRSVPVWSGAVPADGHAQEIVLTRGGTVEVSAEAPCDNAWVFLNAMLVGPQGVSEEAQYAGLEVEYYHGPDWTEGSRSTSTLVGGIAPGRYLLQVTHHPESTYKGDVAVHVREDVTAFRYVCCSFFLFLIVPIVAAIKTATFEQRRWAESDHG
ncbi:MAG: DUF4178 domain-containing protein [Planctomycetota bacterium]|nr:DUF4178 domain-containing protein [Planctomycetota bacterium]